MRQGNEKLGSLHSKEMAYRRWGNTKSGERQAHAKKMREAAWQSWLRKAEGDPQRAESMRREHMARIARQSADARRAKKGAA
jgi:hypothetical protein